MKRYRIFLLVSLVVFGSVSAAVAIPLVKTEPVSVHRLDSEGHLPPRAAQDERRGPQDLQRGLRNGRRRHPVNGCMIYGE